MAVGVSFDQTEARWLSASLLVGGCSCSLRRFHRAAQLSDINAHSVIFQVVPPMQDEPVPMYIGLALV